MRTAILASLAATALAVPAPLDLLPRDSRPTIIPGEYVITLKGHKDDVPSFIKSHPTICDKKPGRTYHVDDFRGFSMTLTKEEATELETHPLVHAVEPDMMMRGHAITTESDATWGLSKLSQGTGAATGDYTFDDSAGEGTCAYLVDTGVNVNHPDFEGRAVRGKNFDPVDGTDDDLNGHGTFVAGTIGSKTYGVAKKTKLIAVKACNKSISCRSQDVISGITWAIDDAKTRGCPKGTVINLSLGGWGNWVAVKNAVDTAANNGIFFAVASGNDGKDATDVYPASAPNACTVAASDSNNNFASFSNYGSVIDVFAPGARVTSLNANGGTTMMSGTSMASPHVAGLAAYLLALEGPADPVALCNKIKDRAVKGAVQGVPNGTNNLLVFNGGSASTPASPAPASPSPATPTPSASASADPAPANPAPSNPDQGSSSGGSTSGGSSSGDSGFGGFPSGSWSGGSGSSSGGSSTGGSSSGNISPGDLQWLWSRFMGSQSGAQSGK
ncbi:cuticle-degrading protease-2 [Elsinoe australis]|uniref:Cuticle-degrading protease-2 n=1 Tax=Elsinoe australis TaxID=40998 RepID=A0A4U7AU26_9PEZI|nr:cuticle-degrading protease-2 [Elsinoe australis]